MERLELDRILRVTVSSVGRMGGQVWDLFGVSARGVDDGEMMERRWMDG